MSGENPLRYRVLIRFSYFQSWPLTDDQTAVWLPKITRTIPTCLETEFEPGVQNLQNLIRDS